MSLGAHEEITLRIVEVDAGERLDRILAKHTPFSRSQLQRWMLEGRITQEGAIASKKTPAKADAEIVISPAPPEELKAKPEAIPLDILYEDQAILVLNKPAGMVVHPAPGHSSGTLVNAVLHHFQRGKSEESGSVSETRDSRSETRDPRLETQTLNSDSNLRPGIVHRLDKDTSGVMVVAKDPKAHETLVEAFSQHTIERQYRAIVIGHHPLQASYDTLHGRHPQERKRFSSRVARGKKAITHIERETTLGPCSLLSCRLETGRTHQIRVHLFDAGYPVLGDPVYRRSIADPVLRQISENLDRQALHAQVLGFTHPITHEKLHFSVEPPADFHEALSQLSKL